MRIFGHRRGMRSFGLIVALGCGLMLGACGSSGGGAKTANEAAGIKFADCMRAHGVPNFPDPGSGGGIQFPDGPGINPRSPAFQSAQRQCSKLLPRGGPPRGPVSEQHKLMMLRLSQCMRKHGFPDFPDPVASPPTPGNGFGLAFGGPGSFIAVPQTLLDSPGFQQAASACGFPGEGRPGSGKRTTVGG